MHRDCSGGYSSTVSKVEAKSRQVTKRNLCPSDLLFALCDRTLYQTRSAIVAFDGGGLQDVVSVFGS